MKLIRLLEKYPKSIHIREYSRLEKSNSAVRYIKNISMLAIFDYERKLILSASSEHVTIFPLARASQNVHLCKLQLVLHRSELCGEYVVSLYFTSRKIFQA